ncbi:MAG: HEAT repeat domain-containing protein [Halobacteriales archaeon]|nr:HEAT repeat domain-containing protein [Halobacteriales archaeon]
MTEPDQPPTPDRLPELLKQGTHEEIVASLDRLGAAETETRKRALRAVRDVATERPRSVEELIDPLSTFLTDEDRAVRLTTAKLFVTLAEVEPEVVLPAIDALADRLADDEEFYYVRARCAEALGYIGREHPEAVSDPAILADFRIGLSFDEPEVKEKLAKALECVALGDPSRLRHQVESLADHLDDDEELVRYHLCTALAAVGCEHPAKLADGRDALVGRLSDADENPYIRGRAAEALGLLACVDGEGVTVPDEIGADGDEAAEFVRSRLAFLRAAQTEQSVDRTDGVGTLDSLRSGTEAVVEAMTTPDGDECPHCGLAVPEGGPPMCPRCGAPR